MMSTRFCDLTATYADKTRNTLADAETNGENHQPR